jgi:hypothetical protein
VFSGGVDAGGAAGVLGGVVEGGGPPGALPGGVVASGPGVLPTGLVPELLLLVDDVLLVPVDDALLVPVDDALLLPVEDVLPEAAPEVVPGLGIEAQNAWTVSPLACASARNRENAVDVRAFPRVVVLDALESGATYAVHSPYRFSIVVGGEAFVGAFAVVGAVAVVGDVTLLVSPGPAPVSAPESAPPDDPTWVFEPWE